MGKNTPLSSLRGNNFYSEIVVISIAKIKRDSTSEKAIMTKDPYTRLVSVSNSKNRGLNNQPAWVGAINKGPSGVRVTWHNGHEHIV